MNNLRTKYSNETNRNLNWHLSTKLEEVKRLEKKLSNLEAQNARRKRWPLLYKFRGNIQQKLKTTHNSYLNAVRHLNAAAAEKKRRTNSGIKVHAKPSAGLKRAFRQQNGTNLSPGPGFGTHRSGGSRQQNNTLRGIFSQINKRNRTRAN